MNKIITKQKLKQIDKAIKNHCYECSGNDKKERDNCYIETCYLYEFRKGIPELNKTLK